LTNAATLRNQHPGYFSDSEAEYSPSNHHPPPRHMSTLNRTSLGIRHQAPRRYDVTDMVDRFLVNGDDVMDGAGRSYRQPPTATGTHYCMPFTTGNNNNLVSGSTNLVPVGAAGYNGFRMSGLPVSDEIDVVLKHDNRRLSSKDRSVNNLFSVLRLVNLYNRQMFSNFPLNLTLKLPWISLFKMATAD
jgi:hypothetical protein